MSTRRRLLLSALLVVLCTITVECLSFVAWRLLDGGFWSPGDVAARRDARVAEWAPATLDQAENLKPMREEAVHPYLGFVLSPDAREGMSEYGFPSSSDVLPRRAPGRVVIGIGGGSVANGFHSDGSAALAAILAERGPYAGREIVFFNTSIPGYKQPQQLFALAWLLVLGAEFDLFINLDGFNEVALHAAENAPKGVFPAYPRNWALRVDTLQDPYVLHLAGRAALRRSQRREWAEALSRAPFRWSVTASLVWRARDRWLSGDIAEAEQRLRAHTPSGSDYQSTGPRLHFEGSALSTELVRVWQESSRQMQGLAEANGIAYFHFLQPNQYVPDTKRLTAAERDEAFDPSHPYARGAAESYSLLIESGAALAREGIAFTDLTRTFVDERETLYIDRCCHFNARGNEILAAAIAEAILARSAQDPGA